MLKNMCLGFEIEGIEHDVQWFNNQPKIALKYFMTKKIFKRKKIIDTSIESLLSKRNINFNNKKLSKIISFLRVK